MLADEVKQVLRSLRRQVIRALGGVAPGDVVYGVCGLKRVDYEMVRIAPRNAYRDRDVATEKAAMSVPQEGVTIGHGIVEITLMSSKGGEG